MLLQPEALAFLVILKLPISHFHSLRQMGSTAELGENVPLVVMLGDHIPTMPATGSMMAKRIKNQSWVTCAGRSA